MHKFLLDIPTQFESERLLMRSYRAGDGPMYYAASLRNADHLARYESDNVILQMKNEEDAEIMVRDLAADWVARQSFFIGAFDKQDGRFIGQVYVGPVSWSLPEFQIGCFVDCRHEGKGYITEAVMATLDFVFHHLQAYRVSAECDETNVRSIALLERCGMIREGFVRENKKNADGSYTGTMHYGILRKEYERMKS
ncbi:MAG: GNAT family N-acetyltransferase [candidate division Zixibacteria bacterium]|nr:GNAT family N-acetyltransferase [candidate division Zixibacteria bacterium]